MKKVLVFILLVSFGLPAILFTQDSMNGKLADKPLFRDTIYDGAADPTVIWNQNEKKWFMFYTNRRANAEGLDGVSWVHGTRIGIAESSDGGATWKYRDTCDIQYRFTQYTHWAPEVVENNGLYHMYLTYVPGIFSDWRHPRWIVHLTSKNLINWKFESKLDLSSEACIDDRDFGRHPGIVINGDRAYIFYFTHPGRTAENRGKDKYETRRSSLQVAELEYKNGQIVCDRNKPVYINLDAKDSLF